MLLTERHIISKNHRQFKNIDSLCFLSKNLYNYANYLIKQHYKETGHFLRYREIEKQLRENKQIDYVSLPNNSSQQILMLLDKNWKSFFALIKIFKKNKKELSGCPKPPKFKDKVKGRNIVLFTYQQINVKNSFIKFPKKTKLSSLKTNVAKLQQVRVIPQSTCYVIEVIYEEQEQSLVKNNNYCAIDLGVNNLMTLTFNKNIKPIVINGKPLKSINQYYNKKKGKLQSDLEKNHKRKTSNRINKLTLKRNNKINDYIHKTTKKLVDICIKNNISKVVIGCNKGWKQNINIGKRNNQNFVNIPYLKILQQSEYKLKLKGIFVLLNEESYTSKCSALDLEPVQKQDVYLGKRIKRGLFKSSKGLLINADVNGSLNIGRKVFNDVFIPVDIGLVMNPVKVNLNKESYIKL